MESPTPTPSHSHKTLGVVLGIIVVFAVGFVALFSGKKSTTPTPVAQTVSETTQPAATTTTTTTTASTASASTYKDGTYSATGTYMSPGGQDQIAVTLTLANDVVTSVTATPEAGDHTSARYQAKFVSGYKQYVVGQKISDIHLTVVSGSSLTPQGFQDALTQIEAQAQA